MATEYAKRGLSPHARGNLRAASAVAVLSGSIPARAGQPAAATPTSPPPWVYPRTRGATSPGRSAGFSGSGLSPHARGNLNKLREVQVALRSIPARAGQPVMMAVGAIAVAVYPRTRGATGTNINGSKGGLGLSPHARGNQIAGVARVVRARSIPARAGQPG